MPSRSGRAPHGASARLDRGPVGAEPSRVDWFSPVRSAPSGCSSAAGFDIRLGDRYRRLGAPGAVVSSARGSTPLATAHAPSGCAEGFALTATAGA